MEKQNIAKEIEHFQKTDWYRLESSDELDQASIDSYVNDLIKQTGINQNSRVLEIASGGGQFGLALTAKTKTQYTGLDLIPDLVKDANLRAKEKGINAVFMHGDAHHLPFADNHFEVVVVSYSLHHFPTPSLDQVTAEVYRVLKKGGFYYSLEPNGLNPLVFCWWLINSPERILPLGKKWRENRALSINESIIYPTQVTQSLKRSFQEVYGYSLGYFPMSISFFKKYSQFFNRLTRMIIKIPLVNKIGASFIVIGKK